MVHIAAGLRNHQLGERMGISRATVRIYFSSIFAKLVRIRP